MNANFDQPGSVRTTCPYCGVGCGLVSDAADRWRSGGYRRSRTSGQFRPSCSKGAALGETIGLDGRLLHPHRRASDGTLMRTTWAAALDGSRRWLFEESSNADGPNAVAFYLSGQLLDRRLLRRQQADERFYWLRQCRHEFRVCAWPHPSRVTAAHSARTPCREPTAISTPQT